MKYIAIAAALVGALTAACGDNKADTKKQAGPPATLITVAKAEVTAIESIEESVGSLENFMDPRIGAEVAGRIVQVHGFVGKKVRKGDLLAEIDSVDLEIQSRADAADVGRLEALVGNQERIVANHEKLVAQNFISKNALDDAIAQGKALKEQLVGARARLEANRNALRKTRVVSPIDGEIEVQIIAPGDYVKVGDPMFQLVGTQRLHAHLPFPESAAPRLRIGQPVRISSPLVPDFIINAKIDEIRPTITATSRALDVIVKFDSDGKLRGGGTVNAYVVTGLKSSAVVVPEQSVVLRPAGKVVYVVAEQRALQRIVQTGGKQRGVVEITAGLSGGELIAVDGAGFLTNNANVSIARPRDEKGAPSEALPTAGRPREDKSSPPPQKGGAS
jgi:membrane fusion protein (multidrug efflux system)